MTLPTDDMLAGLASELGRTLQAASLQLVTAESCSGGWIAGTPDYISDDPSMTRLNRRCALEAGRPEGPVAAYQISAIFGK
jgi:hypothetical protein